jgi:hypothetical protein
MPPPAFAIVNPLSTQVAPSPPWNVTTIEALLAVSVVNEAPLELVTVIVLPLKFTVPV